MACFRSVYYSMGSWDWWRGGVEATRRVDWAQSVAKAKGMAEGKLDWNCRNYSGWLSGRNKKSSVEKLWVDETSSLAITELASHRWEMNASG